MLPIHDIPTIIYSIATVLSVVALFIGVIFFKESLDVKDLMKRRVVIFDNFGIEHNDLNFSHVSNPH